MTLAAEAVLSCYTAEERGDYAILAAIKPNDANDAVLRMAEWLAEQEHQELQIVSVIENAPLISSFAAGVPTSLRFTTMRSGGRSSAPCVRRTNGPGIPPRAFASTCSKDLRPLRSRKSRGSAKSAWWWWERGRKGC